jgi:hypothetical protein
LLAAVLLGDLSHNRLSTPVWLRPEGEEIEGKQQRRNEEDVEHEDFQLPFALRHGQALLFLLLPAS